MNHIQTRAIERDLQDLGQKGFKRLKYMCLFQKEPMYLGEFNKELVLGTYLALRQLTQSHKIELE
jgi:hypothetical protein